MVADAEQLGGIDTGQISEAILQMRRESITPAFLDTLRFLNYEKLGEEIRMEANAEDQVGCMVWKSGCRSTTCRCVHPGGTNLRVGDTGPVRS
jgi:hypothetical protein